jgi:hypothetical protein
MLVDFASPEGEAILFAAVTYILLIGGVLMTWLRRPPKVPSAKAAFELLERSIASNIQDMPGGYSWGEALALIKGLDITVDWGELEKNLADYEEFRYGGRDIPPERWSEVVKLALKLRRRKIGVRPEVKGPGTG